MSRDLNRQLHVLEEEFGLSAYEILDIINRRNRCKIAVWGAIAEAHLLVWLRRLQSTGQIDGFEDFDQDGYPDRRVDLAGRSFLVECKNVEKPKRRRDFETEPLTIDFQRTRNPIDRPWERYYLPSEFDIVAACLWNRTGTWDFRFAAMRDLLRHPRYADQDRLATRLQVDLAEGGYWTADLPSLLRRLVDQS